MEFFDENGGSGTNEDERDRRDQNGMRVVAPGAQATDVQPPSIADVMRAASGVQPTSPASPASPAAPAASGAAPSFTMPPGIVKTAAAPGDIPTPPTGASNQRRMDLLRQMGTLEKPTDPKAVDPQTGKPMYRMSLGQRILGSVANFGAGVGRTGAAPIYVGPGATNAKFAQTEGMREKTLGGVKEELGEQEKLDTSEQKIYEDAVKQAYEGQLGDYRTKLGEAAGENADTRGRLATMTGELNQTKQDLNEAKAGQAERPKEPTNEIELLQAYQTAVVKKDPKAAIYKAAIDQLKQLKAAGKDTSAADLAKALQVSEFKMKEKDTVDKEKESERQKGYAELDKNLTIKYNPQAMAAEKAKIDQGLETKYAPRYQSIQDEGDKMLGLTKAGAKLQTPKGAPAAPSAPNATPAPAATPAKAGTPPPKPTGPAAAGKVWVYDKTTGARGQIPQHQLAAATQGPNAKYATW